MSASSAAWGTAECSAPSSNQTDGNGQPKEEQNMIGTLPAKANPRAELRERLAYLLTVEIPRLEAEVAADSEIAAVALDNDQQEVHDIVRMLAALDAHRPAP